jgi:hypothetical protein
MAINVSTLVPASEKAKDVATLNDLDVAIEALNKIYRQDAEPTVGMIAKDLWFDTNDGNTSYIYNGATWEVATAPVDLSGYTDTVGMNSAINTATASFIEASEVAAAVNNNTTKIDGGKIVTASLFSQNIGFTGKITGGSGGLGGIIQSANYVAGVSGMRIDLVNGSIYIA